MKLVITESVQNILEIEKRVTNLTLAPFDTGVGAIPLATFTGAGELLIGTGAGAVDVLPGGNDGEVLTYDAAQPLKMKWASAGGIGSSLMYNRSGGSVVAGDVIVNDPTNDRSFTTTTVYQDMRVIGVAAESISSGNEGAVSTYWGTITTVNVDAGAVARGDFLVSSTTAKRACSVGPMRQSYAIFAMALTAKAAGSTGTVSALLLPQVYSGVTGSAGWALGGMTSGSSLTTAEKFAVASVVWSAVAGAALATAARNGPSGTNGTTAGYTYGGYTTAAAATSQKLTYATETTALNSASNAPAVLFAAQSAIHYPGTANYFQRGYSGSSYSTVVYKHTFSSDACAATSGVLSQARGYAGCLTDSTISGIFFGGSDGTARATADKITFATEAIAAQASANATTAQGSMNPMNFVAAAVSYAAKNDGGTQVLCNKIVHSTWTASNVTGVPLADVHQVAVATDGNSLAWFAGSINSPYLGGQGFNRVTETWSTVNSAQLGYARGLVYFFNYGQP